MTEGCRKSDLTDGYKVPGVSKKVPPPQKKNFLEYFHFGYVFLREILQICWQFISTYIYQSWH